MLRVGTKAIVDIGDNFLFSSTLIMASTGHAEKVDSILEVLPQLARAEVSSFVGDNQNLDLNSLIAKALSHLDGAEKRDAAAAEGERLKRSEAEAASVTVEELEEGQRRMLALAANVPDPVAAQGAVAATTASTDTSQPANSQDTEPFRIFNHQLNRNYVAEDSTTLHVRNAECIYLRMLNQYPRTVDYHPQFNYKNISSIDYIFNEKQEQLFEQKKIEMLNSGSPAQELLLFHGTQHENVTSILRSNFRLDLCRRQAHGPGIYFSELPSTSLSYGPALILCRVLTGRVQKQGSHGTGYSYSKFDPTHYDSYEADYKDHQSGVADIHVVAHPSQVLPYCVYHFEQKTNGRRQSSGSMAPRGIGHNPYLSQTSLRGPNSMFQNQTNPMQHPLVPTTMANWFHTPFTNAVGVNPSSHSHQMLGHPRYTSSAQAAGGSGHHAYPSQATLGGPNSMFQTQTDPVQYPLTMGQAWAPMAPPYQPPPVTTGPSTTYGMLGFGGQGTISTPPPSAATSTATTSSLPAAIPRVPATTNSFNSTTRNTPSTTTTTAAAAARNTEPFNSSDGVVRNGGGVEQEVERVRHLLMYSEQTMATKNRTKRSIPSSTATSQRDSANGGNLSASSPMRWTFESSGVATASKPWSPASSSAAGNGSSNNLVTEVIILDDSSSPDPAKEGTKSSAEGDATDSSNIPEILLAPLGGGRTKRPGEEVDGGGGGKKRRRKSGEEKKVPREEENFGGGGGAGGAPKGSGEGFP